MPHDPDEPALLASVPSELEAETIAAALRAQGFVAHVQGGMLAGMRAETVAMAQVLVRRADLDGARNALRALRADSVDIDWSEVDVGDRPDTSDPGPSPSAQMTEAQTPRLTPRGLLTSVMSVYLGASLTAAAAGACVLLHCPVTTLAVVLSLGVVVTVCLVALSADRPR